MTSHLVALFYNKMGVSIVVVEGVPTEILNLPGRSTSENLPGRSTTLNLPGRDTNLNLPDR